MKHFNFFPLMTFFIIGISCSKDINLAKSIHEVMNNTNGSIVFVDLNTEKIIYSDPTKAKERNTPCSTFKIFNALIGIENGLISSSDEQFYKWDGEIRLIPEWNRDLKFKEAFQVSCVPAFQNLAVKIGPEKMQNWINRINYGDRNISSGIDIFWLPREGKKSILISPEEQAVLIGNLFKGNLPFSEKSQNILKDAMLVKATKKGSLYGKTGSGKNVNGIKNNNIGWFTGYVISSGKKYSFACLIQGENFSGKDARAIIEEVLFKNNLL